MNFNSTLAYLLGHFYMV